MQFSWNVDPAVTWLGHIVDWSTLLLRSVHEWSILAETFSSVYDQQFYSQNCIFRGVKQALIPGLKRPFLVPKISWFCTILTQKNIKSKGINMDLWKGKTSPYFRPKGNQTPAKTSHFHRHTTPKSRPKWPEFLALYFAVTSPATSPAYPEEASLGGYDHPSFYTLLPFF